MATIIICIIILHDNRPITPENNRCFDGQLEVLSGDDEAGYSGLEGTISTPSDSNICTYLDSQYQLLSLSEASYKRLVGIHSFLFIFYVLL